MSSPGCASTAAKRLTPPLAVLGHATSERVTEANAPRRSIRAHDRLPLALLGVAALICLATVWSPPAGRFSWLLEVGPGLLGIAVMFGVHRRFPFSHWVQVGVFLHLEGACLFAKTHWVCNVVSAAHQVRVHKVEPSLDHSLYRPPDSGPDESAPVVIAAMVRPRTPRRQPQATVRVLERLARSFGAGVEVITFGCSQAALEQLTELPALRERHRGVLSRSGVAQLLCGAGVFVDHSVYQAFGRTALEAMACACVPVVPAVGGAWEFAEPEVNSLVCDTSDELAVYSAVARLVEDEPLRVRLQEAGLRTAGRYSVERAAMSEYALFASALLLRSQTGTAEGLATRVG